MTATFALSIVSPSAVALNEDVARVDIPGSEGDFGVLPKHSAVLAMLRPGVITVHRADATSARFFATSGYADVSTDRCTILSDHVQDLSTVSADAANEAVAAATQALANATTDAERAKAERLLVAAQALVSAIA
jgi:F-type H+-transporting ATPase subunit epsilon